MKGFVISSGADLVRIVRANGRWFYQCPNPGVSVRGYRSAADVERAGRRPSAGDRRARRRK